MKKFTLFIVLLLILCGSIALSAQSEITRHSAFFDNITHAITMDNDDIVVLSQLNDNNPLQAVFNNEINTCQENDYIALRALYLPY